MREKGGENEGQVWGKKPGRGQPDMETARNQERKKVKKNTRQNRETEIGEVKLQELARKEFS